MITQVKHLLLLIAFTLAIQNTVVAQSFKHAVIPLGQELGLNGQIKHNFYYGKRGYLWMASSYGLDRYDGKEILSIDGLKNINNSNVIFEIFETKDSVLAIITGNYAVHRQPMLLINSMVLIQPITGQVIPSKEYWPNGIPFSNEDIKSISNTESFLYFILHSGEIYRFDGEFELLEVIENPSSFKTNYYSWLINADNEYCSGVYGKRKLGELDGNLEKEYPLGEKRVFLQQSIDEKYHATQLGRNNYTGYILDKNFRIVEKFSTKNHHPPFYTSRADDNYFVNMGENVTITDSLGAPRSIIKKNSIKTQEARESKSYLLNGVNFYCYQNFNSPVIVSSIQTPFQNFLNGEGETISVRGITTNKDGLIAANSGGIVYFLNPYTKERNPIDITIPSDHIYFQSTTNYFEEANDLFWVVNNEGLITSIHTKSFEIKRYNAQSAKELLHVYCVGPKNELIITSKAGMYELDKTNSSLVKRIIGSPDHAINGEEITFVKDEIDKTILVTRSAIYNWSLATNKIELHKTLPDTIKNSHVLDYYFQDEQTVWMATSGNGIVKWELETDEVQFYNKGQGLSNNIAYSIQKGKDGNLWIPTAFGLNALDPISMENDIYLIEDGLPSYEFNTHSFHQDKNGILYFGGLNGLTRFDPKDISLLEKKDPPTYVIEVLIKSAKDEQPRHIKLKKDEYIKLERDESLTVKYSSPNVINELPIKYQYKLEGENENWIDHPSGSLTLSSLSRGKHHFKIRGRGIHKSWSNKEANLLIEVPTPFFLSAWFYILSFALIALAGYAYYRRRIYSLEKNRLFLEKEVDKRTLDIQESKNIIEQQAINLKKLDELKSQFFTNVSHELRTPLTLIENPLRELKKDPLKESPFQREHVETALSGSLQLNSIVSKILRLSEFDSNVFVLNNQDVSIHKIIKLAIESAHSIAATSKIELEVELLSPRLGVVNIDIEKITETIENILSNAIKFSPANSKISVQLGYKDDSFFFRCTDEGIGLTEEEISNIFSIYYQGDKKDLPEQGGLGIGLSFVAAYVQLMDGIIDVKSQPNKGSTFTITIPCTYIAPNENNPDPIPGEYFEKIKEESLLPIASSKSTILVLEDNLLMSKLIQNILAPNYEVIAASNGQEAIDFLNQSQSKFNIDLILTDWMMPIMDGQTFFGKLKSNENWSKIPTIMISARASDSDKINSLRVGLDDYLTKPFLPEELRIRIKNLLKFRADRIIALKAMDSTIDESFKKELSADENWLSELKITVLSNLGDAQFSVTSMALQMNLSTRQLTRRVKQLTGLAPGNYLKEHRLLRAQHLLEEKRYNTVTEVCFEVGFSRPVYFSKMFVERFGKLPSSYLRD